MEMENGNGKWKWKNGIGAIVKKVVEHICRKLWLTCYHFVFCVQQRFFPNCPNSIFPFSISIFHFGTGAVPANRYDLCEVTKRKAVTGTSRV